MNEPALRAQGVIKSFPQGARVLTVLKGVDLEVAQGEMVAIVGPSGAGKTTLLNIVGGLMRPTEGSVRIFQQELSQTGDDRLSCIRNQQVGFVFQLHYLLPEFSALENVALPAWIGGESREASRGRAREWLERVGLAERLGHKPGELSGGEQQRVAIARALVNRPALLLADEPSGDLDGETAASIHELLLTLNRERGQTTVLVTHNPELARQAHRIVTLKDGRVAGEERRCG